jgi:hypothetical protein
MNQLTFEDINVLLPKHLDIEQFLKAKVRVPFADITIDFFDSVSKFLFNDPEAKLFPDIVTLAFWIRKSNLRKLKAEYEPRLGNGTVIGRGIVFHITPSNVAVNFMYSLISSMLAGNNNVIKLAPKDYEQEGIIIRAILKALEDPKFLDIKNGLYIIKYGINKEKTDFFSSICDVRIVWGGDATIAAVRKSPLPPRSTEILFADRYSFSTLDAKAVIECSDLAPIAVRFFNDTFLMDQNACSSPRLVVWRGNQKTVDTAKKLFWDSVHKVVLERYKLAPILAIDKYTQFCRNAIQNKKVMLTASPDNYIYRVGIEELPQDVENIRCAGGYFVETQVEDLSEISYIVSRKYQTLTYYGYKREELVDFVISNNLSGIDRIVPLGSALDFGLVWDGYDLIRSLSRECAVI